MGCPICYDTLFQRSAIYFIFLCCILFSQIFIISKFLKNLFKEHYFVIVPWSTCLWIYRVCGLYILRRLLCHWPETDEAMNLIVTLVSLMYIFVSWQSHKHHVSLSRTFGWNSCLISAIKRPEIVDGSVGRGAGSLPVLHLHQPHGGGQEQVNTPWTWWMMLNCYNK